MASKFMHNPKENRRPFPKIKQKSRKEIKDAQNEGREQLILSKRLKVQCIDDAHMLFTAEEEQEKTEAAVKLLKSGKKKDSLKVLYTVFARAKANGELFLKLEGLSALIGCFFAPNSEILHSAAWCVVNLTAVVKLSQKRVRQLAPILLQYLKGADVAMQELCAWAMGNIAEDSNNSKETLLQQGCIQALCYLVATKEDLLYTERTYSVLFALANISKGSFECIRCLQEHCIYKHILMMLEYLPSSSDCLALVAWLCNSIYVRPEVFEDNREQHTQIIANVIRTLSDISKDDAKDSKVSVLPFLYCLGNLVGVSQELAIEAGDSPLFHAVITQALELEPAVQNEALWLIENFIVNPSCCALIVLQPAILKRIFNLSADPKRSNQVLKLLSRLTSVSSLLNQHMVQEGMLTQLIPLLSSPDLNLMETCLSVILELLETTSKSLEGLQKEFMESQMTLLISPDVPDAIKDMATLIKEKMTEMDDSTIYSSVS